MKSPKITVLMSVYNGEKYIKEAIDSILFQTFKDFEFLIINDGSTDRTAEIIRSYSDQRIKIHKNKENFGLTKSLNIGLKLARGEYIIRQDADDISMSERLEKELDFLETHKDYAVVGTFVKIMNENSKIIRLLKRPVNDGQIREFLKKDNCITHGSSMIRMESFYDVGFYDESMERSQDYELWLRISKKYRMANIPEYLYIWRNHKDNIEAKYKGEQEIFVALAKVKNDTLNIKETTRYFINSLLKKKKNSRSKMLHLLFRLIRFATLNRIKISTLYSVFYRIQFSNRIAIILRDLKMNKINFSKAKLQLKNIIKDCLNER